MFVVLDGEVEMRKGQRVLRSVMLGGVFGEKAIIENQPRTADPIGMTNCRVAAVNQKRFLTLVSNTPFLPSRCFSSSLNVCARKPVPSE